jgi:Na+:H+ antiporter, NhaA family
MSIFITNLVFAGQAEAINASKMAILLASFGAGVAGFAWLKFMGAPLPSDLDPDTMDFESEPAR